MMLFNFKSKSENYLSRAVSSYNKATTNFRKALEAAEQELIKTKTNIEANLAKIDKKIEDAYTSYMNVENKYNRKADELAAETELKEKELVARIGQLKTTLAVHDKLSSGN